MKSSLKNIVEKKLNKKPSKKRRVLLIDLLKILALILMVFTHTVIFTFDDTATGNVDNITKFISLFGGTVAFVMFLFLSGSSLFIVLNREDLDIQLLNNKLLNKFFKLIVLYFLLSLVMDFAVRGWDLSSFESFAREIVFVVGFFRLIILMEFLIPLILIPVIVVYIYKKLGSIPAKTKLKFLFAFSVICYFLGSLIYTINTNNPLFFVPKSLLAGHKDIHAFPILQYMSIFIVGMCFSYFLENIQSLRIRLNLIFIQLLVTICVLLLCIVINQSTDTNSVILNPSWYTGRFPPSIPFLTIGLITIYVASIIFSIVEKLIESKAGLKNNLSGLVTNIGKNMLNIYVVHVIVFILISLIPQNDGDSIKSNSSTRLFTLSMIILMLSIVIAISWDKLSKTNFLQSFYVYLRKIVYVGSFFVVVASTLALVMSYTNRTEEVVAQSNFQRYINVMDELNWWNDTFEFRSKIEFTTESNIVKIKLSKATLNEYINSDEATFVVIKNDNSGFTQLPYKIEKMENNIVVTFINNSFEEDVYLYIGKIPFTIENLSEVTTNDETIYSEYEISSLEQHSISIETAKNWYLLQWTESKVPEVILSSNLFNRNVVYAEISIKGTDIKKQLDISAPTETIVFEEFANFTPGTYEIQAVYIVFEDTMQVYYSDIEIIHVSYPLLVVWSLDWEGMGVNQGDLDDISDISKTYNIPIVQFFNPRIYVQKQYSVEGVSPGLAGYYTNWIKIRRDQFGDEVALHLHMYPDLVDEVEKYINDKNGIVLPPPSTDPEAEPAPLPEGYYQINRNALTKIQGIGRDEYSLASFATADMVQVFEWSKKKFQENGLGIPISFRSGAWMTSLNLLAAIEASGIPMDSSGRTGGKLNPSASGSTPIPWNLTETERPFKPSRSDINLKTAPNFSVIELPNNGADSYWFTLEALVGRFNANYNAFKNEKGEMTRPQLITYLSHPHSFKTFDSAKIRGLLNHADTLNYDKNKGPVVFTTFQEIYNNPILEKLLEP